MDDKLFKRMKKAFFPKEEEDNTRYQKLKSIFTPEVEVEVKAVPEVKRLKKRGGNLSTDSLVRDMQVLNGIPPHDVSHNYCQGDGYFAKDLAKRLKAAGKTYEEIFELAKIEGRKIKPSWDRR